MRQRDSPSLDSHCHLTSTCTNCKLEADRPTFLSDTRVQHYLVIS